MRTSFLRGLGLVYFAAFRSLRVQARGLFGERGITPVRATLRGMEPYFPPRERWRRMPTLLWRDASDAAIDRLLRDGERLGLALFFGVASPLTALAAWAHWLSIVQVGGELLGYQWDALLLEAGLVGAIVAPFDETREPTPLDVALLRTLAFRVHFMSGLVKHRSPDHAWRDRSAMLHYYETAPLPTVFGWLAHHLPPRAQRFSTRAAVVIELGAPLLFFGPRALRRVGFAATTFLQALIALTGNYGLFNALTVVVTLPVLDDVALGRGRRARRKRNPSVAHWIVGAAASFALGAVALGQLASMLAQAPPRRLASILARVARAFERTERLESALAPFHAVSPYGPFSVMTRARPEIVVEGSNDGVEWREYVFRYKPSDPRRMPRWVAPHQPRLDWQMWFAALRPTPPSWFVRMATRLLQGSKDVEALFETVPFDRPPRFLRARIRPYRMTSLSEWLHTGRWWERGEAEEYLPVVTIRRPSFDETSFRT